MLISLLSAQNIFETMKLVYEERHLLIYLHANYSAFVLYSREARPDNKAALDTN